MAENDLEPETDLGFWKTGDSRDNWNWRRFFHSMAFGFMSPILLALSGHIAIETGKNIYDHHANPPAIVQPANTSTRSEPIKSRSLESTFEQKRAQIAFTSQEFRRLNKHDDLIIKWTDQYNATMSPPTCLPYRIAKAMMCTETGNAQFEHTAFAYDPMQIANSGDCGLDIIMNRGDNIGLLARFTDFSEFQGVMHTPRVRGKWDYTSSRMTPELSIQGGLAFLFSKAIIPEYRSIDESQPLQEYRVQTGDTSLARIAARLKTTPKSILSHNPELNPNKMQVGQRLVYVPAHMEKYARDWKPWRDAVLSYNGGGSRNHGRNFDFWMSQFEK